VSRARSALDTPMMRQYLAIKAQHPDEILFYRMGDFYELFLDDAELVAPLLEIALTTRDKGKPDPVPMCGVPVHAADAHLKRLADLGHRVAICEQVEDPRAAGGRRLVERAVVEIVTPGLVGDPSGIEALREVSIGAAWLEDERAGLAFLDASTGDFRATELAAPGGAWPETGLAELARVAPRELRVAREALRDALAASLPGVTIGVEPAASFEPGEAPAAPEGFDPGADDPASRCAAALIAALGRHQPFALAAPPRLRRYELRSSMVLDDATRTHLELFANNDDHGRGGTLIEQIDATVTALGGRRLARWLAYPLLAPERIAERQARVAALFERDRVRGALREALRPVRDLERILAKATRPGSAPRDLGQLRASLQALPGVGEALAGEDPDDLLEGAGALSTLPVPAPLPELAELLEAGLVDDPPVVARGSRGAGETGYIRAGFRSELDALREGASKGREWIAGLEAEERRATGIANLKARYHPVHGYSLEVSKTQLAKVPDHYERKQTLANVERFTTERLREVESQVMGANERAAALERELLAELRDAVTQRADDVRAAADAVASLDALASLAEVARRRGWVRPEVDDGEELEIRGGRHPVVEAHLQRSGGDGFVPNDSRLCPGDAQLWILTGPNMSGKSTYLRQVALIALLAQMGSWVPAESARVGVVDRIFTRVGASDRLSRGESTFMVEMRETAEILRQASRRSLVILDEIGRGTSTFDGLSIAWAVAEYLHDEPGLAPRTLFATHYHELTALADRKERVRNAHFEAREWKDEVIFLRRLVEGGASRSYGIQVARLAGLPDALIGRAREILAGLERSEGTGGGGAAEVADGQLGLFGAGAGPGPAEQEVLAALRELDPERTTPMDALLALKRLHERLHERLREHRHEHEHDGEPT